MQTTNLLSVASVGSRWRGSRASWLRVAAALALTGLASVATAQNVANGKTLYTAKLCAACHTGNVKANIDGVVAGANDPNRILAECSSEPDMIPFCSATGIGPVSRAEATDIAAFIASEAGLGGGGAPAVTLSATALTFNRAIGAGPSDRQNLKVTNSGDANLVLANVALAGTNPGDYALLAPAAGARCQAGTVVAAKATCSVDLTFDPSVVGARNATLVITPDAASKLAASNVALNGTAVADVAPVAKADVTDLNFGTQSLNLASAPKTITLTNAGDANLTLAAANAFALAGTNAADFAVNGAGTCKDATTLAPKATCTVVLVFTPKVVGSRVATLTVKSNAADVKVNLTGTGQQDATPAASSDVSALDFGSQLLNTASDAQKIVVTNSGSANLVLAAKALVLSGTQAAEFAVDATSTCVNNGTLAANASCTVLLKFTPKARGNRVGVLTLKSNANDLVINLKGAGVDAAEPVASADVSTLDFGAQLIQTESGAKTVVISNTGTANLVFADDGSAFETGGADGQEFVLDDATTCDATKPLAPKASCTLVLKFIPEAVGNRTATLTVNSNATQQVSVALAGAGQAAGGGGAAEEDAGGCSTINPNAAFDPVLGLLASIALGLLVLRRRRED